jgi:hypothetical protein
VGFGDVWNKVKDIKDKVMPPGPWDVIAPVISTIELVRQEGWKALYNRFNEIPDDVPSVAEKIIPEAKKTPIIKGGLEIVKQMEIACGYGKPLELGEPFGDSGVKFNEIADGLETAKPGVAPGTDWHGEAADAYLRANDLQVKRCREMPEWDFDLSMCVRGEANAISGKRTILRHGAIMMGDFIASAVAAQAIPRYGKAISLSIQSSVVGVTIPTMTWHMNDLDNTCNSFAETVEKAARGYNDIAKSGGSINA